MFMYSFLQNALETFVEVVGLFMLGFVIAFITMFFIPFNVKEHFFHVSIGWFVPMLIIYLLVKSNFFGGNYDESLLETDTATDQTYTDLIDDDYEDIEEEIPLQFQEIERPAMAHFLLHGGAGQGKTALAKIIAKEIGSYYQHDVGFITVLPSQLRRKKELDEVMLKVAKNPYCILFIDEIHGMPLQIEESLYSALQDYEYGITLSEDVEIGQGISLSVNMERGVQMIKLPKFTCIGATTLIGEVNKPLRDRFPVNIEMDDYEVDELEDVIDTFMSNGSPNTFEEYAGQKRAKQIAQLHLKALSFDEQVVISADAKTKIAKLAMKTSRLVIQYTKNCIVVAKAMGEAVITPDVVDEMRKLFDIDEDGLTRAHRAIIKSLLDRWRGTPEGKSHAMGAQALANAISVTKGDFEKMYEPSLVSAGILTRDGRSMRMLTQKAINKYKDKL